MNPLLEEILNTIARDYNRQHDAKQLTPKAAQGQKNLCITSLVGRMEVLDEADPEYQECAFVARSLANGWLVSDIDMLRTLYQTVRQLPEGDARTEGETILGQFASMKTDTLTDRFEMIKFTNNYLLGLSFKYPEMKQQLKDTRTALSKDFFEKTIYPSEYPNDKEFARTSGKEKPEDGVSYREISRSQEQNANRYLEIESIKDDRARSTEDYILEAQPKAQSGGKKTAGKQKPPARNAGQRHNDITKRDSQAICEVIGDAVYDEIDEMRLGTGAERRVRLHHSLGTKYQKQGHDVLEMDFSGSGGQDVFRLHKGRNGRIDKKLTPQAADDFYGKKATGPDGSEFKYIRHKDMTMDFPDGSSAEKVRYTIAGPSPDYLWGLPNLGPYSIENSREYARYFAEQFLEKRFEEWRKGGKRKPIHIQLSGHSRGAVTAGQAAKYIDDWISNYIETHPGAEDFKEDVHYNLTLRDPVPGMVTDTHLGSCNLRGIPNMNAVVFCSMGIEAPDLLYPMQHVRGARKLILTTDAHEMDLRKTDESQNKIQRGAASGHMLSYYDADTGEMHRGSGLNELPDGIYVADEKQNLIRMTSYSQVNEMFGALYTKSSPQRVRARRIHKMVRDWFLENDLAMSFPDERTRKYEEQKNSCTQEKIMQSTSKRMRPVQEEIEKLRRLQQKNPSKEELMEQNSRLIEACRTYMQETGMPPSGVSAYKVGLVSDTLSYTMRHNNQLTKELSIEKGENRSFPLDDKIKAHKDRLEKKDGYLDRKRAAESRRLEREEKVLELIRETSKKCRESLETLEKTFIGKSNSSSYKKMHKILEEGTKLSEQTSVNEMSRFLRRFTDLSESYRESHDSLLGPITGDGIIRLTESQSNSAYGQDSIKKLNELTAGLGDGNAPIQLRIDHSRDGLQHMKSRQEELAGTRKQEEIAALKEAAQPAPSL